MRSMVPPPTVSVKLTKFDLSEIRRAFNDMPQEQVDRELYLKIIEAEERWERKYER